MISDLAVATFWAEAEKLLVVCRARVRVCEQVRDDLADQLRKALTQIERLKLALVRYHDCKDRAFHLKTNEEIGLESKLKVFMQEYNDARNRVV